MGKGNETKNLLLQHTNMLYTKNLQNSSEAKNDPDGMAL